MDEFDAIDRKLSGRVSFTLRCYLWALAGVLASWAAGRGDVWAAMESAVILTGVAATALTACRYAAHVAFWREWDRRMAAMVARLEEMVR